MIFIIKTTITIIIEAKDIIPNINQTARRPPKRPKMPFLSLVTLTFDF